MILYQPRVSDLPDHTSTTVEFDVWMSVRFMLAPAWGIPNGSLVFEMKLTWADVLKFALGIPGVESSMYKVDRAFVEVA